MKRRRAQTGKTELRRALRGVVGIYAIIALFSLAVNLLMLAGPLYMLNVYDRVLGARSVETLVALSALVVGLYLAMGVVDGLRARLLARAAARVQDALDMRVFRASLARRQSLNGELEAVRNTLGSPAMIALFDLPWSPLLFFGVFIFHPILGVTALCGSLLLLVISIVAQMVARPALRRSAQLAEPAQSLAQTLYQDRDTIRALGMQNSTLARWRDLRQQSLSHTVSAQDRIWGFSSAIRMLRLGLQSAMLGVGAWLVLSDDLSAGAMIASSVVMGRALAPIEVLTGQWGSVQQARDGWRRIEGLLNAAPEPRQPTPLPEPRAVLDVRDITAIPPGDTRATLQMISFIAHPGQAIGVIGPSGAGKTTLARVLCGAWTPSRGRVRLDGAVLAHYDPDVLGRYIGYLPQVVRLLEGSIAENIARMDAAPRAEDVIDAAKAADAHDLILSLPDGYDTHITPGAECLSGGQIQRIGLARALYGAPKVLILDEPNSQLDSAGTAAMNAAVARAKQAGQLVIVMAHRPAAIEHCDMLMILDRGQRRAFGPKDEVLQTMVANHGPAFAKGSVA